MLPRWHIFYGALFTPFFWIVAPITKAPYLALIFLASFFLDIDHYICAVLKTRKWSIKNALDYYKKQEIKELRNHIKGIRKKGDFQLFHTIEFHALIAVLGIFWVSFFYIFIGMAFHSLLDLFDMIKTGFLYRREYFFFNWLRKKL